MKLFCTRFRTPLLSALLLLTLAGTGRAQQKRIYLAPDDHTDYLWSGTEAQYRDAFLAMTDYYLDLADSTASNPSDSQSRWNCDGSFWLTTYEQNRTPAQFDRLLSRIRDGHFSAPLTTLVGCYGGTPAEGVLRGMYYAGRIERRYNLRFPLAVSMENQTLPYGLGSLWAGSGAKYSWRGVCACGTSVANSGDREHEIYYWKGPDNSRILMKWNSLYALPQFDPAYRAYYTDFINLYGGAHDRNENIGGYGEARYPFETVEFVDTNSTFRAKYPYPVIGAFGEGWDNLKTLNSNFVTASQTKANAGRRVIVSNETDFFGDFEANYGAGLPEESVTFGNEWDLSCASLAEVSAGVKRSTEKLRSAEALAVLGSWADPAFIDPYLTLRDTAMIDYGLYWEHDFVGAGPGVPNQADRVAFERKVAGEIGTYVNTLQSAGLDSLSRTITKTGTNPRFFVFNPLGWLRTDLAQISYTNGAAFHVTDLVTGQDVPSEYTPGTLKIMAANLPSAGYRVYEIRPGAGASFPEAVTASGSVIENAQVKVTVNSRGAITSLLDKTQGSREFIRTVNGKLANDLGGSGGTVTVEGNGVVSRTLKIVVPGGFAHTTRITLYRGSSRVDIQNEITQNFTDVRKNAFSFNLTSPDTRTEEVGAVILNKTAANGGQYSDRAQNSRYDWVTLNHFADMTSGGAGITLSNEDCYFAQLGNSTLSSLDTATPQINVLVGGKADPQFGLDNQGGDTYFLQRFALLPHGAYNQTSSMKFALEHQNSLLMGTVSGTKPVYPEGEFSALRVSNPDTLLWAFKPAEDGIRLGVTLRTWNQTGTAQPALIALPAALASALQVTHIETDLAPVSVGTGFAEVSHRKNEIVSTRVVPILGVSGQIQLIGSVNLRQPVRLTFSPAGGGTAIVRDVTLTPDGDYSVAGIPAGDYRLLIKGAKWLAKRLNVTISGPAFGINAALIPGDVNNNNAVDVDDLTLLLNVYNSTRGDGTYTAAADLTCNGTVDVDDLTLLLNHYNTNGDTLGLRGKR